MTKMQSCLLLLIIMSSIFHHTSSSLVRCANATDVMFLLDDTASITDKDWTLEIVFVADVMNGLYVSPEAINVGFTLYSTDIDSHTGLAPFRYAFDVSIILLSTYTIRGVKTNTAKGIAKVRQTFQDSLRSNAQKVMILITDGSSENSTETIRQAQMAKADGIRIIVVGIGMSSDLQELHKIATNLRNFYYTPDFAALRGIESDLKNKICGVSVNTTTQSSSVPPTTTATNK